MKRMDGFVALRRIYVDGETKNHGYVYHDACTTVKPLSHWAAAVGEKLRTAFAREFSISSHESQGFAHMSLEFAIFKTC